MKERLITSLIAAIVMAGLKAEVPVGIPKLIVGVTIDQLRNEYIEAFASLYGTKGFKRLQKEARIYLSTEYPYIPTDIASSISTIYTGTVPSVHGIIGSQWLDRKTLRPIKSTDDRSFIGYFTSESTSPQNLLASSVTDELKQATSGKGLVYSISPSREVAVFSAGHIADGAFWLNDETGKWSGSTYYGAFPYWLSKYNDTQALDLRIKGRTWYPSLPTTDYQHLPLPSSQSDFQYTFSDYKSEQYKRFKETPLVNDEVNRLFEYLLEHTEVGKDNVPDMITLSYYAGTLSGKESASTTLEIQDAYVRVDKSLGELIDLIDKKVGLQNTLFLLTGTPSKHVFEAPRTNHKIPAGEFHMQRCVALLNMYLVATHGEGEYIEASYRNELFLNRPLIEKKGLTFNKLQEEISHFILSMSGVQAVYSSTDLRRGAWFPHIENARNNFHPQRSGDIQIALQPGWSLFNEYDQYTYTAYYGTLSVPVFFFGNGVKPSVVYTPVSITTIAPTLAGILRIRSPNAAITSPLWEVMR